jgi:hypothetical protein
VRQPFYCHLFELTRDGGENGQCGGFKAAEIQLLSADESG